MGSSRDTLIRLNTEFNEFARETREKNAEILSEVRHTNGRVKKLEKHWTIIKTVLVTVVAFLVLMETESIAEVIKLFF